MELRQNSLEQFEPEKLPVGWPWRLFTVSFFVFLAMVFVYLGIILGYQPFLNSRIQEKDDEIAQLAQAVSKEDQEKFIQFYSQLVNLKNILDNHITASDIFPFLERATNQKVYYVNAALNVIGQELSLRGIAGSYTALVEQLESFNQSDEIEHYILNQAQASGGEVQFDVTLKLRDTLLK